MSANANDLPNAGAGELPIPGQTDNGVVDLQDQWLSNFGLGSDSAPEPPLGTDGPAGDGNAGAVKSSAATEKPDKEAKATDDGGPKREAGADADEEAEGEADEDLDDEDRAINAAPKEHQAALRKTKESAKFETYFRGGKPPKDVLAYMKTISKGRYDDVRAEAVRESVSDTARFLDHDLDDETYGKLVGEMVKRDPNGFAKFLTGKKAEKLSDVMEALDQRGKAGLVSSIALPDLDSADAHGDNNMEALEQDWPEAAAYLKAVKLAQSGDKAFSTTVQQLTERAAKAEQELAELKSGKAKSGDRATEKGDEGEGGSEQTPQTPESIAARQAVQVSIGEYVDRYALDKDGLDLAVTDAERDTAPEVADLKDTTISAWVDGNRAKKIPSFETGFFEWAKGKEKFMDALKQVKYYTDRGEPENAVAEAKRLNKYIDQYRKVRIELPYFKSLEKALVRAKHAAGHTVRAEKHITGGGSQQPSPNSRQAQSDDEFVNTFGL